MEKENQENPASTALWLAPQRTGPRHSAYGCALLRSRAALTSARLCLAVDHPYRLPPWTSESHDAHKYADKLAAAREAHHVVVWRKAALRRDPGIVLDPLDQDPLPVPEGMNPWELWPPFAEFQ